MPSLLLSQYTKPVIIELAGSSSPKLLSVLLWPAATTTPLMTSLAAVLPPVEPAVSLPSSLPIGCDVSVTV